MHASDNKGVKKTSSCEEFLGFPFHPSSSVNIHWVMYLVNGQNIFLSEKMRHMQL